MRNLRPALILVGFTLAATGAVADGALDPSFWSDGRIWLPGSHRYATRALLTAPDGRLVVVGTQRPPSSPGEEWFWRRVGDAGYDAPCVLAPQGSAIRAFLGDAAFDPQGRLVIAGSYVYGEGDVRPAAARFLYPGCTLDPSFDGNGVWGMNMGQPAIVSRLAIAPSGRILLAGEIEAGAEDVDLLAILLFPSGALVASFSGGWTSVDPSGVSLPDYTGGVSITPGGQVLLAASSAFGFNFDWSVTALTPTGEPDPDFGDDGTARIGFDLGGTNLDALFAMARDPASGQLVLAGRAETVLGSAIAVARLLPDGTLDSSFSGDGLFQHTLNAEASVLNAVAVDGLGRVVGVGTRVPFDGNADFLAVRLTPSGSLDPTFTGDGWRTITFDAGPGDAVGDEAFALTLQSGNYALGGTAVTNDDPDDPGLRVALARLRVDLIFADGFESSSASAWSTTVP
jgi:uncharacterized delta-60 repeat protein